jgi:hypothetical protein
MSVTIEPSLLAERGFAYFDAGARRQRPKGWHITQHFRDIQMTPTEFESRVNDSN